MTAWLLLALLVGGWAVVSITMLVVLFVGARRAPVVEARREGLDLLEWEGRS